jgi:phosphate:Na+ symporter
VDATLDHVAAAIAPVLPGANGSAERAAPRDEALLELRARTLRLGETIAPAERGAILALLGSAERAGMTIARLDAERRSVPRVVSAGAGANARDMPLGGGVAVPAE